MNFRRPLCLAALLALAAGAAPAQPAPETAQAERALRVVQRLATQYVILFARTAIDLTYESLSIDPRSQETVINGLVLRPRLGWDPEGACEIRIARLAASNAGDIDVFESLIEVSGLSVPAVCLQPGAGMMLQSFGYETVEIDRASINAAYEISSSAADIVVSADVAEAAELTLTADFDYVWIRGLMDEEGGEPEPVAKLASAELAFENAGLWERVSPMLSAQFGDVNQLPGMVGPLLSQLLAQPGQPLGEAEQALVDNVTEELARFVREGDRLVLTMAPEGGVWLQEDILQTPARAIAALQPELSSAPLSIARMVEPSVITAALAGGEGLDDAARLRAAGALVTGIGAPRAPAEGLALVEPLAERWNAEAAALAAEALAAGGDAGGAYAMALRAMAGEAGTTGLADRLETGLADGQILTLQAEEFAEWPRLGEWQAARTDAQETGDVSAMRRLAFRASSGAGAPRNYREAYFLASLAAAAGDAGAAALRDRLDARFTGFGGEIAEAWLTAREQAAGEAVGAWTEGGVAEQVMRRYGAE
jgi:TPR repeat protein